MLRHRGQPLIEEELERVMICSDDEATAREVWPPVSHGLDKADELAFVGGCKLEMARNERLAEKRDRPVALV